MLGTKRPHDGAGPSQPLVKPEPGTAPYGYRTMPAGMALRPAGVALTGYPAGQQRVLMPAAGGPGMSLGAMPGMPAGARPLQQQQQPGGATMQGRPVLMQGAPGQPPRVVIIPNHAFMQLQAGQGGGVLNLASGAATSALQAAQQQAAQQQAAAAQQQQQAQQQQAALSALGGAIANASAAAVAAAAAAAAAPAAGGGTSASQPPGRCAGRGGGGGLHQARREVAGSGIAPLSCHARPLLPARLGVRRYLLRPRAALGFVLAWRVLAGCLLPAARETTCRRSTLLSPACLAAARRIPQSDGNGDDDEEEGAEEGAGDGEQQQAS